MKKETTAVVLAGGVGSRLRPLTSARPKPLAPIGNHPMLDYALWSLGQSKMVQDVIVVVRYLGEQIRDYVENTGHFGKLNISVPNVDPLDTADALRKVANLIDSEQIIVCMADIITNLAIADFIKFHESKDAFASITLKDVEQPRRFGVIMVDKESEIQLFLEKPQVQELYLTSLTFAPREPLHLEQNLVNTGIYCFDSRILGILEEVPDLMDFGKHVFPYLLQESLPFYGYIRDYYWMDCGDIQAYLWANYDLLRRWAWPFLPKGNERDGKWTRNIEIGVNATIESETAIGSNTTIGENVRITSGSVIGENCHIGNNSRVDRSVIWDNVIVGENVQLTDCVVCDGVKLHLDVSVKALAAIGKDSEIAEGTTIEAGTKIERGMYVKGKED
ncbi:MAG: sugar phosphate nucleotidyltransferase [Candidatus Heimdallarchaeota archaeon]